MLSWGADEHNVGRIGKCSGRGEMTLWKDKEGQNKREEKDKTGDRRRKEKGNP